DVTIEGVVKAPNSRNTMILGHDNYPICESDIRAHFILPPNICVRNVGVNNVANRFDISSDGDGEINTGSYLLQDSGKGSFADLRVSQNNTRHRYLFQKA